MRSSACWPGSRRSYGPTAKIGLVWFDAHGDFNTPKTTLSGMIGGMPVAVSAGLAFPHWRRITGLEAPIPTDRIVMVDVRNLDPKERTLIEATAVTIAAIEPGREGVPMQEAIDRLAADCDVIYLHIDEDVLDERYVPNHGTVEPNGPDMAAVLDAVRDRSPHRQGAWLWARLRQCAGGGWQGEPRLRNGTADDRSDGMAPGERRERLT